MTTRSARPLANRRAVRLADIDVLPIEHFRADVCQATAADARLVALFGVPEGAERLRLVAVLADDERGRLEALSTVVAERYPALTPDCPQASRFERELSEQCGVTPEGHGRMKPLRRHAPDHAPTAWQTSPHAA